MQRVPFINITVSYDLTKEIDMRIYDESRINLFHSWHVLSAKVIKSNMPPSGECNCHPMTSLFTLSVYH